MEKIWTDINFETYQLSLKDGPVDLLKMNDEHLELLDEHQLLVQSLASNKYLAYYEERVLKWQRGLSNVNETIKLVSDVQKTWSFLINLFIYSQEVKKELPEDSLKFVDIDKYVRGILDQATQIKNISEFSNL